jgi:hypothetical protein
VPCHRPFLCAAYLPDARNRLVPGSIRACPLSSLISGSCRIVGKGWRERKSGPFQRLKLCLCRVHGLTFTIYPFGMMPYLRRSLIDDPNLLSAVSDAAQDIRWPELASGDEVLGATLKTQRRHILLWCRLLSLLSELESDHLQASLRLGIANLHLREAFKKIMAGPSYVERARIVMSVLRLLTERSSLKKNPPAGSRSRDLGQTGI